MYRLYQRLTSIQKTRTANDVQTPNVKRELWRCVQALAICRILGVPN